MGQDQQSENEYNVPVKQSPKKEPALLEPSDVESSLPEHASEDHEETGEARETVTPASTAESAVTTSQPGVSADWAFVSGARWRLATSATTANKNEQIVVKSATQINITLAASVSSGDFFVIANSSESGSAIRIVNAGYTIKTVAGSIKSTDNIILARGETAHFVATSSTILEAV